MTLDEAITHAREVAEKQRKDNDNCEYKSQYECKGCADYYSKPCIECAEEHEQLAEWLEDLKAYIEIGTVEECKNSVLDIERAYNKAIDDYAYKAIKIVYEANNRDRNPQPRDMVADIHYKFIELAKQLKAGGENISSIEWIPISERLPNPETYVLLSFENFSIPVIGRYEQDKDGGSFCAGDKDETLTSQDMYVNAWMPLPEPYKGSEDIARNNR